MRHDAVDHAEPFGFVRGDHLAGQQQFLGLGEAHAERGDQHGRAGSETDFWLAQHRLFGSDLDVAQLC